MGEAAEVSAGGGERGMLRELATLTGAALTLAVVVYFGVAWVVEWTLPLISVEREMSWFEDFPVAAMEAAPTNERAEQREFARATLAKLAVQSGVPAVAWRLELSPDGTANAYALPGGTIVVTTGLMDVVGDDEIALAFVLGHELGHFVQRDHLRGIGRSIGRTLVWTLIFGGAGGTDLFSQRADQLLELGYSRRQESGADEWGVRLVMATYGSIEGSERLFEWLAERERLPAWTTLLSSHPASANRIEQLRWYAGQLSAEPSK